MERALGRGRSGGDAFAIDADRQTYQCGLSQCSLDPSRQHHDAGAGHHSDAIRGAPAVIDCESAIAVGASEFDAHSRAGSSEDDSFRPGVQQDDSFRTGVGQKAAGAEGSAHGAGSARAGGATPASTSGCGSRSRERLILPKAVADR